ncbi:MAG: trigger factor, partial [Clostridia bacterium]|nr:trigger factor [Clostridia bacterium]
YEEAVDALLPDAYEAAVKEMGIDPVDMPKVEVADIGKDKDLVIKGSVTVKPEVKLGDYKGLKLEEIVNTVSNKDVDEELTRRQERNARQIAVEDRAVAKDDIANINFEGFVDGVAFAGGKGENYDLVIGSNSFIPGFEDQIIGKKIGEEFDVEVTFPEDYHSEELKGKAATFKTKVNSIMVKELPALDDEFAKDVSEFDTLDELKADIKAKLKEAADARTKQEKENAAIDAVIETMEADIPDCMVDSRIESTIRENNARMSQQGISFEQYLGYMGTTVDQFKEQIKPNALLQVKGTLALEEIARLEKLEAQDADVDEQLKKMAEAYGMELDKVKEFMRDEDIETLKSDIKITKALEFLVENATWSKAKKTTTKKAAEKSEDEKEAPKKTTTKKTTSSTAKRTTSTTKKTTAEKETAAKKPAAKKTTTKKAAEDK